MFLEVLNAEYIDNYLVKLTFNTGETKTVDLQTELNGNVYEPLKHLDFFKNFELKYNTLEWENGADFAPEYLYDISF